jgi:hypothetical protein
VNCTDTVFTLVPAANEVSAAPIPQVSLASIAVGGVPPGYTSHAGSCPATVGGGSRVFLTLAPA